MKKTLIAFTVMLAMSHGALCLTLSDLKNQIIDQTKVTALTSGGPSMIYDFNDGTSGAFRVGATDHFITNRWLQGDISWVGGTDGHVDGLAIFGPSVILTDLYAALFPISADNLKLMIVPIALQKVWVGIGAGWGTDDWRTHWTFSIGRNF